MRIFSAAIAVRPLIGQILCWIMTSAVFQLFAMCKFPHTHTHTHVVIVADHVFLFFAVASRRPSKTRTFTWLVACLARTWTGSLA